MRSLICSAVLLLACGGQDAASDPLEESESAVRGTAPSGRVPTRGASSNNRMPIEYHGGPLMMGPTSVYFIWYGTWTSSPVVPVLTNLAENVGASAYFDILSTYPNAAGTMPQNAIVYSGAITDSYSMGATLTDSDIALIVSQTVAGGQLPADPDAVYVVLADPTVDATSGLCSSYCAFHSSTSANNTTVKYAFIGNPTRCPSRCAAPTPGPNGTGADGMASLMAAELFDSITDPLLTGWYDRKRLEPASKCAWTYGDTYPAGSGSANMSLGSYDYLLQQIWVNPTQAPRAKGYCATEIAAP